MEASTNDWFVSNHIKGEFSIWYGILLHFCVDIEAPKNLQFAPLSPTVVLVGWEPPDEEQIYIYNVTYCKKKDCRSIANLDGARIQLSNLEANTTYSIRITPGIPSTRKTLYGPSLHSELQTLAEGNYELQDILWWIYIHLDYQIVSYLFERGIGYIF